MKTLQLNSLRSLCNKCILVSDLLFEPVYIVLPNSWTIYNSYNQIYIMVLFSIVGFASPDSGYVFSPSSIVYLYTLLLITFCMILPNSLDNIQFLQLKFTLLLSCSFFFL